VKGKVKGHQTKETQNNHFSISCRLSRDASLDVQQN